MSTVFEEVALENNFKSEICQCLHFNFEERHATVSVWDTGERAIIMVHMSSKRDFNQLIKVCDNRIKKYRTLYGNRVEWSLDKRSYKNLKTHLQAIIGTILQLGYE